MASPVAVRTWNYASCACRAARSGYRSRRGGGRGSGRSVGGQVRTRGGGRASRRRRDPSHRKRNEEQVNAAVDGAGCEPGANANRVGVGQLRRTIERESTSKPVSHPGGRGSPSGSRASAQSRARAAAALCDQTTAQTGRRDGGAGVRWARPRERGRPADDRAGKPALSAIGGSAGPAGGHERTRHRPYQPGRHEGRDCLGQVRPGRLSALRAGGERQDSRDRAQGVAAAWSRWPPAR